MQKQKSHTEVIVDPPKPWLIYAVALTKEQVKSLANNGAVELNLYVTSECHIRVNVFGDHENEIDKVEKVDANFPMKGSWFKD